MAVNFPNSPFNGEQFTANGVTYQWNSTTSLWEISLVTVPTDVSDLTDENTLLVGGGGGQGVTAYTNMSDLPMTGNSTGAMAFITSTNGLFIWNGATWYGVTVQSNTGPTISSVQDGSGGTAPFTLSTLGAATVVTVTATDPEGAPLTYSYSVTSGSLTNGGGATATVTQNGNVFTVTPTTTADYAGTFELTFTASDGELSDTSAASFTLQFATPLQADTQGNTLLLTTSGSAGDNSVFTDSSSNALTITSAGTPSSQSFSPYRAGGYSVRLDGSTGWIDTGVSDNFGTGDVTFECWVKTSGGGIMLAKYQGGSVMEAFQIATNNGIMASHTASGTEGTIGTKDLRDNQWHHLVFERYNGTYYYYADGELQGTLANTENAAVGGNWIVGKHGTADIEWYDGEIRDLKLTVGTAVYGGTTPAVPTEPVSVDGTETLVLFTGIPYGKDLSPNNGTFTANGGVTFVPEGPYDVEIYDTTKHGGSVYFDGSGDYLTVGSNIHNNIGTGAFTAEAWVYLDEAVGTTRAIFGSGPSDSSDEFSLLLLSSGHLYFDIGGTNDYFQTSWNSFKPFSWNHVALSRSANTLNFWVNGENVGGFTTSAAISGSSDFKIGGARNGSLVWKGFIADAKITIGTSSYSNIFTPPTQPQSSVGAAVHVVGTDANIYDATQTVKPVTLVGNADSSITRAKYTTSSIYMDGTGYVELPAGSINISGSQDYTIEGWINFNSIGGDQGIFQVNWPGNNLELIMAYWNGWATYINGVLAQDTSVTPTANQWYHIAVTRASGTVRVFLDGSTIRTVTGDTTAMENMGLIIGGYVSTGYLSDAYFEDWRITTGLARYTEDFTVPTESLLTYTPPPAAAGASAFTFTGGDFTGTSTNAFTYSSNALNNTSGASKSDSIQNGKVYFEVDITTISNVAMGLYPSSLTDFGFTTAGGASIDSITGDIYPGPVDENATITNGSVLMFAADATAQKVWIGVNGTWTTATGDPATGSGISTSGASGETYVFAVMSGSSLGSSVEATILTSGGLNYTVPTGFSALADVPTGIAYGGTRGILSGDWETTAKAEIDYFDIQTAGSSTSFGSLNTPRSTHGSVSNGSRACFMGGSTSNYGGGAGRITDIEYVTPATPGNGTSMGDLNSAVMYITSSPLTEGTYGYCPGGGDSSSLLSNIDVFSIDNGGTATTYGNMLAGKSDATGISNATQGIVLGGYLGGGSTYTNAIEYFAFGTTGQVYDFGDIDTGTRAGSGAAANSTLGIFAGGIGSTSSIDYISLASPGNSAGVGTLTAGMNPCGAATDGTLAAFVALSGSVVVNTINIDTQGTATSWGSIPTGPGGNRFQYGSCTSGNAA